MLNDKKVVLVTGASSGFGKLIVKLLADNNLNVVATMRDIKGKNLENAKELRKLGDHVMVEELDVTSTFSVKAAITNTLIKLKRIDVVVNNAGIMNVGLAEGFTVEQLNHQMDVNYLGVARLFKEVLPHMKSRKDGLFITISSVAGRIIFPFLSTYNPSKYAVEALAEVYRYELSPFKVDSVIIEPGPFPTNLIDNSPRPLDKKALEDYGDLKNAAEQTMLHFKEFMKDNPDCDSNLIAEATLNLINTPYGQRPTRTVCGVDYGVREINSYTEKYQLEILKQMGLEHLIPN